MAKSRGKTKRGVEMNREQRNEQRKEEENIVKKSRARGVRWVQRHT